MKTSNISYLRNHLSEMLSCVREGETVMVLDRDKPIARLVPYSAGERVMTERMKELQQLGLLTLCSSEDPPPLPPLLKPKRPVDVAHYILEEREST
ncbi:MAG: type II toxin-antitoxin system Phd/YefM family antitoxin [Verrucomicrobia bacterium]|nr:type II toxin-antitoxin system Phd/YefM family antitoxin [Verrucomicrobiota bacterium]MCH8527558.1 type II toxin-antitoxin system Phd/YefM family antitoxin [Kiritimatiellia bacterium]